MRKFCSALGIFFFVRWIAEVEIPLYITSGLQSPRFSVLSATALEIATV